MVDLLLSGHSHSCERSMPIDGHHGQSSTFDASMKIDAGDGGEGGDGVNEVTTLGTGPHEGCVYAVAGRSGKSSGGSLNHPVMITSLSVLDSMILDVDGSRLDARFIDDRGAVCDHFTMIKGTASPDTIQPRLWIHGRTPPSCASGPDPSRWPDPRGA